MKHFIPATLGLITVLTLSTQALPLQAATARIYPDAPLMPITVTEEAISTITAEQYPDPLMLDFRIHDATSDVSAPDGMYSLYLEDGHEYLMEFDLSCTSQITHLLLIHFELPTEVEPESAEYYGRDAYLKVADAQYGQMLLAFHANLRSAEETLFLTPIDESSEAHRHSSTTEPCYSLGVHKLRANPDSQATDNGQPSDYVVETVSFRFRADAIHTNN